MLRFVLYGTSTLIGGLALVVLSKIFGGEVFITTVIFLIVAVNVIDMGKKKDGR